MSLDPALSGSYDYELPPELIAKRAAEPKSSARLLVYDRERDRITHTTFARFFEYLPNDSAVLLNDTKVIKARIHGRKESGGKVELLVNSPVGQAFFEVMIKGRVQKGGKLLFDNGLCAVVEELLPGGTRIVSFWQENRRLDFYALAGVLETIGHVPLPPYIDRPDDKSDEKEYQSVFASRQGAVAAPTASLHFDQAMYERLQKEYETRFLTLHVGAGTFKPVQTDKITDHPMHSEYYEIGPGAQALLDSDAKITAIGTTVTRTAEYYARTKKTKGQCDLFLHPGNPPVRVDHLLTNFHLPKSTLLMLVASFVGIQTCLRLYEEAVRQRYRFFSYGDGMLII